MRRRKSTFTAHTMRRAKEKFFRTKEAFAPLFFYCLWVPLVADKLNVPPSLPAPDITGVFSLLHRIISFFSSLLPYFGQFILTALFWVLGIPTLAFVFLKLGRNHADVVYILRESKRFLSNFFGLSFSEMLANARVALSLPGTLTIWCRKLLFWVDKLISLVSHKYMGGQILEAARISNEEAFLGWTISRMQFGKLLSSYAEQVRELVYKFFEGKSHALELSSVLGTCFELFFGTHLIDSHKVPSLASFQTGSTERLKISHHIE